MKKLLLLLCFAWIIHFQEGGELKVDKIRELEDEYYGRRAYFVAEKSERTIIVPWFNVNYRGGLR